MTFCTKDNFFLSPPFSHPGTWLRNKRAVGKKCENYSNNFLSSNLRNESQWASRRVSQRFIIQFYSLLCTMWKGDEEKSFFTQDELHLSARHVIIGAKLCCRNLVFVINDPREKRFDIMNSALRHSIELRL